MGADGGALSIIKIKEVNTMKIVKKGSKVVTRYFGCDFCIDRGPLR
jgi:hypothetical protein